MSSRSTEYTFIRLIFVFASLSLSTHEHVRREPTLPLHLWKDQSSTPDRLITRNYGTAELSIAFERLYPSRVMCTSRDLLLSAQKNKAQDMDLKEWEDEGTLGVPVQPNR
jgi:hypothetical protein